jgi:hypothetical protein
MTYKLGKVSVAATLGLFIVGIFTDISITAIPLTLLVAGLLCALLAEPSEEKRG